MSGDEGCGQPHLESAGELALARIALDDGDPAHAANHIAGAVAFDPAQREAYELVVELYRKNPAETVALFEDGNYVGTVAIQAFLRFLDGSPDDAVTLIGSVVQHQPELAWTDAPWFGDPAFISSVSAPALASGALRAISRTPDPVAAGLLDRFRPWIRVIDAVAARPFAEPESLGVLAILLRRCGMIDESLALCDRADEIQPVINTAVVRGGTLRHIGKLAEAVKVWERALTLDPDNVSALLDIADVNAELGKLGPAMRSVDRALGIDPDNVKLQAAELAYRMRELDSRGDLVPLVDLVRSHPEIGYLGHLLETVCADQVWLSYIPHPTEAVTDLLAQFAKGRPAESFPSDDGIKVTLSGLEAPSALATLRWAFPEMTLDVTDSPAPDIRVPGASTHYALWSYDGNEARAIPAPPSPAAVEVLYRVARYGWSHPLGAYDAAVEFAALPVEELLSLLAHVQPPPPDSDEWRKMFARKPAYWHRFAQSWTAIGLLHVRTDEPWATSTRRAVLVDLLHGLEDWAAVVAAFALAVAGWIDPDVRADVANLVGRRFLDFAATRTRRPCEVALAVALVIPMVADLPTSVVELARTVVDRDVEDGR